MFKRVRLCLFLVLAFILAAPSLAQEGATGSLRKKAEAMKRSLGKKGFVVKEGAFVPLDAGEWYCNGWLFSCNMNNAGAPYNTVLPPEAEGQAPTGFPAAFRLRRDEAIVFVGPTPPTCRYYSYTLFVYYRWDPVQQRTRKLFDTFAGDFDKNLRGRVRCRSGKSAHRDQPHSPWED